MIVNNLKLAPRYYNIFEELLNEIETGKINNENKFPSETELCARFKVSRGTVREALKLLEQYGIIKREQGKGTFITKKKFEQEVSHLMGFSDVMKKYNIVPSAKLLQMEVQTANERIRDKLKLLEGEEVVIVKRLRLGDSEPLIIENSYFVYSLFKPLLNLDLENSSIFKLLYQHTPLRLGHAIQYIEAVTSSEGESEYFNIPTGSPLLLIKRLVHLIDGRPFEFSEDLYRSDKLKFVIKTDPYEDRDLDLKIVGIS
jgi:Transcriptional regulators